MSNGSMRLDGLNVQYLTVTGGTMTGALSVISAVDPSDATPKSYVDAGVATRLPLAGGTLTGALLLGNIYQVKNLAAGSSNNDAITVSQYRTGSLGRTAWLTGELVKTHVFLDGSTSYALMPTSVIAAGGTKELFTATAIPWSVAQAGAGNKRFLAEFSFSISPTAATGVATNGIDVTITIGTGNSITRSFSVGVFGIAQAKLRRTLTCRGILTTVIQGNNNVTVTVNGGNATESLTVENSTWSLILKEYAA